MKLAWLAPDIQMEILYFPPVSGVYFPIRERALRKSPSARLGRAAGALGQTKAKKPLSLTMNLQ